MVRECISKSPMVGIGQTFVTKWGNIRVIRVDDAGSGMIGIKPNGWNEVQVYTVDHRDEVVGPMLVTTNFYTMDNGGCIFWVCGPDVTPDPTPAPLPGPTPTPTPVPEDPINITVSTSSHGKTDLSMIVYWQEGMSGWENIPDIIPNKPTQFAVYWKSTEAGTVCGYVNFEVNGVLISPTEGNGQCVTSTSTTTVVKFKVDVLPADSRLRVDVCDTEQCPPIIIVCRKGCIEGTFTKLTGRYIDGACERIENSPDCGYVEGTGFIKCQAYDSVSNAALSTTVRIDGVTIVPTTPCTTQGLSPGSHTVTFVLAGYSTKTVTVTVVAGETVNAYGSMVKTVTPTPTPTPSPEPTPVPALGYIKCQAYDSVSNAALSATVKIDNITIAPKTPCTTQGLSQGYHTVAFIHTGYLSRVVTVYVTSGKIVNAYGSMVKVAEPTPTPAPTPTPTPTPVPTPTPTQGSIRCQAYDSVTNSFLSASLKINGLAIDQKTPHVIQNLTPASHTIEFSLEGYLTKTVTVRVVAGVTANAYGSLVKVTTPTPAPTPVPGVGSIRCQAYDSVSNAGLSATVGVSGSPLSPTTPYTFTNMTIGAHTVSFELDGYVTKRVYVTVVAGETVDAYGSMVKTATPTPTPTPVPVDEVGYIRCQAYDSVTNEGLSATLRIDGTTIVPMTPHTTSALSVGSHTITFILVGYITKDVTVTVKVGETVDAYGSMVKEALPDVPGFNINVNIPGLLPNSSLHVEQVVKIPLTDTWWDSPIGHAVRWNNISNGVYKVRGRSADSDPTPDYHVGFDENEDYVIYVGTSAVAFYPGSIVHRATGKVTEIDLTDSYIDWVSSKVCAALDITPANCSFFIASSVSDAAFFLELWSIITKHENLAGEHTLPTALDYALLPVAIFGMLSPGISEGKVVQVVGRRITELIPLSRKGTPEIKAVMQDPNIDTFLLRATESQFKDFVRYIEDGLHINAKNLLKTVDDAPMSKDDLHAIQRASNFVEELDSKLIKAGSLESLKTVLHNFSPKFAEVLSKGIKWATAHPFESVVMTIGGASIAAIWYIIENSSINYDRLVKTKGIEAGDTSWTAKDYISVIETYMYNVKDAEKAGDRDAFCENLALWKAEVDKLKAFLLANGTTLRAEGTYDVIESSIQAHYKAIEIKETVYSCVTVTLPESIVAEVIEIEDGDTVKIRYDGSEYSVRFLGINALEGKNYDYTCTDVRSPFLIRRLVTPGKECIEEETWTGTEELYNASKVWLGQNLPVHQMATFKSDLARQFDKYGRLLAVPFYNDKNVCIESLKAGYSVVFFYDENKQVNTSDFLAAEQTAKNAEIGVWAVEAGFGTIKCVSYPTAAEVWLDGVYTDKKTISSVAWLYDVSVGEHTVEFKKIVDGVSHACSRSVTVTKDGTVIAECTLVSGVTPTPTPTPGITPTPIPIEGKALWIIGDVKNEDGISLYAARVYVDNEYIGHYAPETLTFCSGCACDSVIPCDFGTHTVTVKVNGYADWSKTRTLSPDDHFRDDPVMLLIPEGAVPVTFLSQPSGATIKVDGEAI